MASGGMPITRDKARVSGHLGSAVSWSLEEVKRPSDGETLRDSWLHLTNEVPGGESEDGEDMLLGQRATTVSNDEHAVGGGWGRSDLDRLHRSPGRKGRRHAASGHSRP